MADVVFCDYSLKVKNAIEESIIGYLHEAGSEISAQTQRNTPVDLGQLKGSWSYSVDSNKHKCEVGSPLENAIWNEVGTGEYALNGNGRKGYWVYVKGSSRSSHTGKSYTLEEAKKAMAILRSQGLEAFYTNGKKPQRSLHKSYTKLKPKLIKRASAVLKSRIG